MSRTTSRCRAKEDLSLRSRIASPLSPRTSSTEDSPTNSFSSQPVGTPLAGTLAGGRSDTGTRTRPAASAIGKLTPAASAPVGRAGGTSGRAPTTIAGDADGALLAAGGGPGATGDPAVDDELASGAKPAAGAEAPPDGEPASGDLAREGGSVSRSVRAPEPASATIRPK